MLPDFETTLDRARTACGDELKSFVQNAVENVLLALLENPHVDESHITMMLDRLDLPAIVVSSVAAQRKWMSSEGVRLRVAGHPRTPKPVALAAVRQLYLLDLVRLSLSPSTPAEIQRTAEELILHKAPHLPVGQKLTLARRGPARVAGALLAEGHPQAIKLALCNTFLSESQVLKVLAQPTVPESVITAVAQHPKWSCLPHVRMALVSNPHTPISFARAFLPDLTLRDLKEIATGDLDSELREHIQRELERRSALSGVPGTA